MVIYIGKVLKRVSRFTINFLKVHKIKIHVNYLGDHQVPTVSGGFGSGSNRPIVIKNIITLDGQIIDRRIRKVALEDIGLQV